MAMEIEALPIGLDLTGMAPEGLAALRKAVRSLEHPGLAARLANMVGKPVELLETRFPLPLRRLSPPPLPKVLRQPSR